MLGRILTRAANVLGPVVLGRHPNNTIFSFNYFNVRHLRHFMEQRATELGDEQLVVLDLGGGHSPYHEYFRAHCNRYVVVDSPASLPEIPRPGIEAMVGRAEAIPLPDASVDLVLFNQVLEHVVDPDASLREIARVLKPLGAFLGSVPHVSPVHLEPYDFRRYTDLGLRELLERHGFRNVRIEASGGVHASAALLVTMDWMLTKRREGEPQAYSNRRAVLAAPLVGAVNAIALVLDRVVPDSGRSAANLCWSAQRSA